MQNPFNKLSPAQAAFLSGLLAAILAAVCELLKTGQPLSWNLVLYALASAIGGYLAKTAIPGAPVAPTPEPAPAETNDQGK
jgi:hypothetical protein